MYLRLTPSTTSEPAKPTIKDWIIKQTACRLTLPLQGILQETMFFCRRPENPAGQREIPDRLEGVLGQEELVKH